MTTETARVHPEIEVYREHIERNEHVSWWMRGPEQREYEERVKKALVYDIARLYALEYDEQRDVPQEVYALIERLEQDLQLDLTWQNYDD